MMDPIRPRLRFAASLALLALAACENGTGSRPPAGIADLNPGARTGVAFAALDSVRVRVVDASGSPVYRAEVAWTVASGGGTVSPATSRTDAARPGPDAVRRFAFRARQRHGRRHP